MDILDMQPLTPSGNAKLDRYRILIRHSGSACFLVLGLMAMEISSTLASQYVIVPLAKKALNSSAGGAISSGFKNYTWLIGPAMIAATQLLRDRTRGTSATERDFLNHGVADLTVKERYLSRCGNGDCDIAYTRATEALARLDSRKLNTEFDITASKRLAIHSSTRIAIKEAFGDNPAIAELLLRKGARDSSDKPLDILASDILKLAVIVKDELDVEIPDNISDSFDAANLKKLLGSHSPEILKGWNIVNDLNTAKAFSDAHRQADFIVGNARSRAKSTPDTSLLEDIKTCQVALDILIQGNELKRAAEIGTELIEFQERLREEKNCSEDEWIHAEDKAFDDYVQPEEYLTHTEFLKSMAVVKELPPAEAKKAKKSLNARMKHQNTPEARNTRRSAFLVTLENVLMFSQDRDVVAAALRNKSVLIKLANDKIEDEYGLKKELGMVSRMKGWAKQGSAPTRKVSRSR